MFNGGCASVSFGKIDDVLVAYKRLRTDLTFANARKLELEMEVELEVVTNSDYKHANLMSARALVKSSQDGNVLGFIMEKTDIRLFDFIKTREKSSNTQKRFENHLDHSKYRENFVGLVIDTAHGLSHLHSAKRLHTDLSTSNVCVVYSTEKNGHPRAIIIDFGRSCKAMPPGSVDAVKNKFGGIAEWLPKDEYCTEGVDVYSLGMIMMQGAYNVEIQKKAVYQDLTEHSAAFGIPYGAGNLAVNLMWLSLTRRCIDRRLAMRPTLSQVLLELNGIKKALDEVNLNQSLV